MQQHACACCGALPDFLRQCLLRLACHPTSRRTPNWTSEEAHLVNTTLNQPSRRRVSTDRLNRAKTASRLHLLRLSPALRPPEKTLPHLYPKTRFRRERERAVCHELGLLVIFFLAWYDINDVDRICYFFGSVFCFILSTCVISASLGLGALYFGADAKNMVLFFFTVFCFTTALSRHALCSRWVG